MTAAFLFGQDIHLRRKFSMRRDGAGFCKHLSALHLILFGAAKQHARVISCLPFSQLLIEHFNTGCNRLCWFRGETNQFNFIVNMHLAALNTTGYHRAAPFNGEDIFNGHQERLVNITLWFRDVFVKGFQERYNRLTGFTSRILKRF